MCLQHFRSDSCVHTAGQSNVHPKFRVLRFLDETEAKRGGREAHKLEEISLA